jgi:CBS domain containing-hemolysin-like protein
MNSDHFGIALLKLVGVLALVLLNGFFVAAEFAFVKLRGTQVDALVVKGHRRARVARRLVNNLEACISSTQMGITLCGVATGALVKPLFQTLLRPAFDALGVTSHTARDTVELVVGFVASTFLLIVVGELVPKSLAIRQTLTVSLWTARPLEVFYKLVFPFIWILNHSSQWLLGKLGIASIDQTEHGHSEEELRLLLNNATPGARTGPALGRNLVLNAFDIRSRVVREVLRPRREITVLDTHATLDECLEIAHRTRYSRFPLCEEGDIDRALGVIHIKDIHGQRDRVRTGADLVPLARKLIYVPETARLERLLELFLERQLHLALVVDEYGSTVGMVTLENILEELVGQIQDEFDQEKPLVVPRGDRDWEVDGILPLHALADLVGTPLREEGLTTTSGLVSRRLGGFPKPGDTLELGLCDLRVEQTDGLRVTRLRVTRRTPAPPAT